MFIREITSRFRNLNISVEIDPDLLEKLDCRDKSSTQRSILFNLYKLIYAIGTIQTRRFAPSNRMKFIDKSDLIEKIYPNITEFRVKLNEIRQTGGEETLASISEDFGVGISVVIAEKLFNIKFSTIARIYGHKKRPDWKCQTINNRILVVESKGASSQTASDGQERKALSQKTQECGDINVASLTVIKENETSTNRFLDPPSDINEMNAEMEDKILRAGHYSSVFSFIGWSLLSRYYSQMRKRLLKSISQEEQTEKNTTYFKLRDKYPEIHFKSKVFIGSFYRINKKKFLFIGIDESLISHDGFLRFKDYKDEVDETIMDNHYILFKDGILIIEINKIQEFESIVKPESIKHYQENITISDIDYMTEISFTKYVTYILNQNDFETKLEQKIQDFYIDIVGVKNRHKYLFELKLYKEKSIRGEDIRQLAELTRLSDIYKIVLITNAKVPNNFKNYNDKIILIDRDKLKEIVKNKYKLVELLDR